VARGDGELAGALAAVSAVVGRLPDAAEAPDAVLVARMGELVRLQAVVQAALVEQVAAFDARAGSRYDGQTSTRAWLGARLRLGGQAGLLLVVARQLGGLAQLGKALAAGEIGLEHAAVVAQLVAQVGAEAVAGYEAILLDLARQVPPGKLRLACGHLRQLLDSHADDEAAARAWRRRHLSAARTVDGAVHVQGMLDAVSGEVVLAALGAAMPAPDEGEQRSAAQRRADALVDVCAGWLAAGTAPTSGGIRPQVQVTVSLAALQTQPQPPEPRPPGPRSPGPLSARPSSPGPRSPGPRSPRPLSARPSSPGPRSPEPRSPGPLSPGPRGDLLGDVPILADGQPITPGQARRIACDAAVIPIVLGGDSEPLDIARATRVVPAGLRRALQARDGGCRFPGCDRPAPWCDAHHLIHWADGGPTSLDNLILTCRHHHTLLHHGWQPHGHPADTIRLRRPDGTTLDITSTPPQPPTHPRAMSVTGAA
jgi:hypothetical protein